MKLTHALITFTLMGAISQSALAELKPEDAIKFRQASYSTMSWNMSKIKAMMVDHEQEFDEKTVMAAANAIAAIANSGMGALYIAGSEKNIGNLETHVKPEMFTDKEGVKKVAVRFIQAANDLQKAATSGNEDTILKAFKETGASCKACHDQYRHKH